MWQKGEEMINNFFLQNAQEKKADIREGDLYKIINIQGHTFELYYGYYEEIERNNPAIEPMPIYPDFLKNPIYNNDDFPFVTKMQDACKHYKGKSGQFKECAECEHYLHGDDLIGICACHQNKK